MLIGMGTRSALLPVSTFALKEIEVQSSFRYYDTYPEALLLLSSDDGKLGGMAKKLVTHRFKLEETKEAFELLSRGVDEQGNFVLKIMVGSGVPC
jgi:L-iditol 2-dehydrogenase